MESELDKFSTEVDDQRFMNPELATQENDAFIQNLRGVQAQQNLENRQTLDNLGSYPSSQSNLGGLGGGEATFINNYQTTPTNNLMATLRATAEAQALTQAMKNEVDYLQNKYKTLYRAKSRAARSGGSGGGGTNPSNGGNTSGWDGEFDDEETDGRNGYTAVGSLSLDTEDFKAGGKYIVEPGSGNIIRVDDSLPMSDPNYQQTFYQQADGSYALKNKKNTLLPQAQNTLPGAQPALPIRSNL